VKEDASGYSLQESVARSGEGSICCICMSLNGCTEKQTRLSKVERPSFELHPETGHGLAFHVDEIGWQRVRCWGVKYSALNDLPCMMFVRPLGLAASDFFPARKLPREMQETTNQVWKNKQGDATSHTIRGCACLWRVVPVQSRSEQARSVTVPFLGLSQAELMFPGGIHDSRNNHSRLTTPTPRF
jgi:hypothetical protein